MTLPIIFISVTLIAMLISVVLNLKIKIKSLQFSLYWIIILVGAIFCIIFGWVNFEKLKNTFFSSSSINPLKILVIFLSLTVLSILLDEIGFFKMIAIYVLKKYKTSQLKIFIFLYLVISLLTIVTSNDIIILTFTPFICYFCKNAKISPPPYVLACFIAANTWSNFLIIGNPTNIYLATSLEIDFFEYFLKMALPTIAVGIVSFFILFLLFKKQLKEPIDIDEEHLRRKRVPKDKLIVGLTSLVLCIILMSISSYINIEMWYIPLFFASFSILTCLIISIIKKEKKKYLVKTLSKIPYSLAPLLLSMSVFLIVLNNIGFINNFADLIQNLHPIIIGLIAFMISNVIINIPMTMLFTTTFQTYLASSGAIYSTILASNISAFLTPIGALAGIMFMNILKENKLKFSYKDFIKYGLITAIPSLLSGLLIIWLI